VLHILPYFVEEKKWEKYKDKNGILKKDQRHAWWKNYGNITGKRYKRIPNRLKNEDLDQLTAQPLLNYLVALSFERGKIKFTGTINLNEIYEDLLKAVHERTYEKKRIHKSVERLKYPHFIRILEEIAIAAWHGDGRTTTVREIEAHCKSSGMEKMLEEFKIGAKGGMVSLMAAFYFRKAGRDPSGDETFEFSHKSFGEFLAAKRIINKIQQIHKKRIEREEHFDEGWSVKDCLVEWAILFGPKILDWDLIKFISNEIEALNKNDKEYLKSIQGTIIQLINHMLKTGCQWRAWVDQGRVTLSRMLEPSMPKKLS
jgi:hypothetical protein